MIAVIDYGMGNLRSVEKALTYLGADVRVTADPQIIAQADHVILPGVGAFDRAILELKKRGLTSTIKDALAVERPFLAICLGMQLLFESSEEGREPGLGYFKGAVRRFPRSVKVPHMGWNRVHQNKVSHLFGNISTGAYFYFVHSYYVDPQDTDITLGTTDYDISFTSCVSRGGVLATQFHPEKSQEDGISLLRNFLTLKACRV